MEQDSDGSDLLPGNVPGINYAPEEREMGKDNAIFASSFKRSVSEKARILGGPTSPIQRAVSEGGLNDGGISLSNLKQVKVVSKVINWWKSKTKKRKDLSEEQKMRHRLKYHFMSPMQKYKHGRKPFKLLIQIVKIIIVTAQVALFGAERFSSVLFINHTQESLQHLFIEGYQDPPPFSYYSRQDLASALVFAKHAYNQVVNESIGIFWYNKSSQPISLCIERYSTLGNDSLVDYSSTTVVNCTSTIPYDPQVFMERFQKTRFFDSLKSIYLEFELQTMFMKGLRMLHRPECYHLKNKVDIKNDNGNDGKLEVVFQMEHHLQMACPKELKLTADAGVIRVFYISFDLLVVVLCTISLILCLRSVFKSIRLGSIAQTYFLEYKSEELTRWDLFALINKWFFLIVLSDLLSVIGSIYKIRIDYRDIHYYNICSLFLGIGVLLVWVGILRFFTYLQSYNILLIALRVAAPTLMRFMICALFIFFGFTFCGWIVLGPYNENFDSFMKTCDILYSLLNGDDIYVTFNIMSDASLPLWIFSKLYLYVFISLFMYVVLSTFISIVTDSYERMKESGKMPPTRIESFMSGAGGVGTYCEICAQDEELSETFIPPSFDREITTSTTSTSSYLSASLE